MAERSGFIPRMRERMGLGTDPAAARRWWQLVPWDPPAETAAERRRWFGLMLACWLTMLGALVAALSLRLHPVLLVELTALVIIAFPVVWRLHFRTLPRFWPNQISFVAALVLGIVHWRLGLFSGGEEVSRLVVSYRVLVSLFYWVMAFRAFAIRTVRDLAQTALPACSGLLLVLIATRAPSAILGATMVIGGTLLLLAGEHQADRARAIDARIPRDLVRGGSWRPTVNSWLSLLLAAAVAAAIIASVATRIEPSNAVGQWLRRELAWRLARLMIRDGGDFPYAATRTLALGGPAPPPQDRLMLIVKCESPVRPRTAVYDLYDGNRWRMSPPQWRRIRADNGRFVFPPPERVGLARAVTEQIEVQITSGYAFVGLLPVPWCVQQLRLDSPSVRYDASGMVSFSGYVLPGDTFTAQVASPNAVTAPPGIPPIDRVDLENALQLPKELPRRVRELARRVVTEAEADSPLMAAIAIENYLRDEDNFIYDLDAPPVPEAQDYVDHFLFTSHTGFCNHFATAMAVMLRAQGIPCRLATGFTAGEYQPEREVYEIRDQDAHAWVEAYLPRIGWVDFDPTPDTEEVDRSVTGTVRAALGEVGGALRAAAAWARAHVALVIALALVLAGAVTSGVAASRWYARRVPPVRAGAPADERVLHVWRHAQRVLTRAGLPRPPSAAPWEYQRSVAAALPALAQDLSVLTGKYLAARFGASVPSDAEAAAAEAAFVRLLETVRLNDQAREGRE